MTEITGSALLSLTDENFAAIAASSNPAFTLEALVIDAEALLG